MASALDSGAHAYLDLIMAMRDSMVAACSDLRLQILEQSCLGKATTHAVCTCYLGITTTHVLCTWYLGNSVHTRWKLHGTHNGPYASRDGVLPPTGGRFEVTGLSIDLVRDGLIVEHTRYTNEARSLLGSVMSGTQTSPSPRRRSLSSEGAPYPTSTPASPPVGLRYLQLTPGELLCDFYVIAM